MSIFADPPASSKSPTMCTDFASCAAVFAVAMICAGVWPSNVFTFADSALSPAAAPPLPPSPLHPASAIAPARRQPPPASNAP